MAPHIVSRCAPASDPPTMARGSCQTWARKHPVLLGLGDRWPQAGAQPVGHHHVEQGVERRRCPARRPRRRTVRPSNFLFSGANVSSIMSRSHTARCRKMPASSDWAPASSRRRVSGSENAAMRSSTGSANTSRQPGRPSRIAPCSKLRRICMVCGSVSARTVAPRSAAAVPAASWFHAPSGFMADTPSTFQLTGRSASSDIVAMKSISSAVNPLRQPGHDQLDGGARRGRAPPRPAAPSRCGPPPARAPAGRRRRCACAPATWRSRAHPRRARCAARRPWRPRPRAWPRHPRRAPP